MSFLSRLSSLFALKQKTAVKLIALMSVIAFVANLTPELYRDVPSQADVGSGDVTAAAPPSPPTAGPYIIVNAAGNSSLPWSDDCILNPAGTPFSTVVGAPTNVSTLGACSLDEAIMKANGDVENRTITIIFSNAFALTILGAIFGGDPTPTDILTVNLPNIDRPSGYPLVIDGSLDNGKISLADGSTGHNTLDYFFRISHAGAPQNVTIKNFSFRALAKIGSAAITTDIAGTTVKESGNIGSITIQNNYFGTADGSTLVVDNIIYQPIKLYFTNGSTPTVNISNNIVYNSLLGIELGSTNTSTQGGIETINCLGTSVSSTVTIDHNKIGLNASDAITDASYNGQGGWSLFGIYVCSMHGVVISNNNIANSTGLFGLDKGIDIEFSEFTIRDNNIGAIKNTDGSFNTNTDWTIFGYGIYVNGNTIDSFLDSNILNNTVANVSIPFSPAVVSTFCVGSYAINAAGRACGGTALMLNITSNNNVYNNTFGNAVTPNAGYGVEIEGEMIGNTPSVTYLPSTGNKVFNNLIGYNLADGIHVGSISRSILGSNASLNQPCSSVVGISTTDTNNCSNSIIQNKLIRNGLYNQDDVCISSTCTGSPAGGIGIDLKTSTDTTEQKYGDPIHPSTGTGTTNDSDLTANDGASDADMGGNSAINTPILYGTGSDMTGPLSSTTTINGNLSENANGNYWVEVFAVQCPAELFSTTPVINATNALTNCDTDSTDVGEATRGQGFKFLCGAYVTKTSSDSEWSCDPSTFGNTFPIGLNSAGLITATATKLNARNELLLINSVDAAAGPGVVIGTIVALPGLAATDSPQFTCEVVDIYDPTNTVCNGRTDNYVPNLIPAKTINNILNSASDTSEFSENVQLDAADMDIVKTVRSCTGPLPSNCTGAFSDNVSRQPGQYVEFQIQLHNNSTSSVTYNLTDTSPTGLTFVPSTCAYYHNLTSAPTDRPSTGSNICNTNTASLTVVAPAPLTSGDNSVIYVLAQVGTSATSGLHTNTARVYAPGTTCAADKPCLASANVEVNIPAVANLVKTIESPDTNSNLHNETLNAPTASTTVNYQIKVELTGATKDNASSLIISDNFPRAISTAQNIDYASSACQFTMQRNLGTATAPTSCDNLGNINSTNTSDLAIWHGLSLLSAFPDLIADDNFTITITYHGVVPANPLLSTDPTANIANIARFVGTGFSAQSDTTTLVITAPTVQVAPVPPTIHKQVRACTGTTADTCTGTFNETGISGVAAGSTVEYRLEATSSSGATFAFKDPAPTGITFVTSANSCLVYSGIAQLSTSAARPTTGGSPCTFDSTSGVQLMNNTNQTITANQYAYVYALATVASTATGTITNTASLTGNGCTTDLAQCSDPATVTIAAATPGQVTIDKQVNPTTVTSSTTATQDVTYTIVLSKPNTFAINNATWTDTFPTTPVALSNYTCTSVTVLPAGAQTIACPTTFPPAGGTLFSGTINAAVTSITMTYTARVPVNAATSTAQSVTNSTTIAGTRSTDAVALSQTDTAVLTVNPNTGSNGGNTNVPVVSLSKRADNNVTSSDRSLEKIYKPGDTVNYTLSLLNSGAVAATGVTLQDVFHSMLKSMTINTLPTGATQSLTSTLFNFGNINVPTGTTPTTVTYHGTIADKSSFDLDLFDLKENSNPSRDDDFYAPKDADIEDDIGNSNNSHKRAEDILGAPDDRFVSLGSDGEMTINLGTKVIVNGSGDDFALRTINNSVDDTDQSGEDLKVSVSQDGTTFKTINPRSTDEYRYDLSKAKMSWIRYIRLTDESSSVKAKAPGVDIDAICLLNIGVQLPNRVNMTIGTQSAFATEYVTVDVTKVFSKKPSIDNCSEPAPTPVIQQELPPPPPAPLPPAPVYVPAPTPPALPKTGAEPLVLISVVSSLAWVFTTRKKK